MGGEEGFVMVQGVGGDADVDARRYGVVVDGDVCGVIMILVMTRVREGLGIVGGW